MTQHILEFREITSIDDPMWGFVERVFEDSFPPDERRQYHVQRQLAATEPRFRQCVVIDSGSPVAIVSYWMLDEGNYLEHIATSTEARGGGLGAAIITHLMATVSPSWFGEVELPSDELCRRRIGFYERLGFVGFPDFPYIQPAYGADKQPIPMMIMAVGYADLDDQKLTRLTDELLREVYMVKS